MSLIVQKFGGSSVGDARRIRRAAELITQPYRRGDQVVAVVSAQGDTTDRLIEKAAEISESPPGREMDTLLSTGEQSSMALMAMAVEKLGCPVVSLTGWQAGIRTNSVHGNARISRVDPARVLEELGRGNIVIVAGFQGIDDRGDITTLGRGGSDTTAVALAAALHADRCQIFTDVEGIFTADPRVVPEAVKLTSVTYDQMQSLASLGSKVLHDRSVETAKARQVQLEVLSSLTAAPGTLVGDFPTGKGAGLIGVTADRTAVRFQIAHGMEEALSVCRLMAALSQEGVTPDLVVRREEGGMTFTIPGKELTSARRVLTEMSLAWLEEDGWAKVSAVGQELLRLGGEMFQQALAEHGISAGDSYLSGRRFSALIPREQAGDGVRALHEAVMEHRLIS